MTIEPGQCVAHGHVIERCCALFEPRRARPFLRPALEAAIRMPSPPGGVKIIGRRRPDGSYDVRQEPDA